MTVRAEAQIDLARVDDGSPGAPGTNGATFTPSVAADGDISWTNDGGLPNPPTQNIMGPQGDPGTPGTAGVSVTAVEPQYYLSTSDASATGGSWSSTPQAFVSGYYYWTREYVTFSDGTHDTSTEVYNAGMTKAAQDAYDALDLADDTNQYFWYAPTGDDTGAHITEVPQDEWNDNTNPNYHSGGNLLARSNGIAVRNGMVELASFGATAVVGKGDSARTVIGNGSTTIYTPDNVPAFNVSSGGGSSQQTVVIDSLDVNLKLSKSVPRTRTYSEALLNVVGGTSFTIRFSFDDGDGVTDITFVRGTSSTTTHTFTQGGTNPITISFTYNGSNQFTYEWTSGSSTWSNVLLYPYSLTYIAVVNDAVVDAPYGYSSGGAQIGSFLQVQGNNQLSLSTSNQVLRVEDTTTTAGNAFSNNYDGDDSNTCGIKCNYPGIVMVQGYARFTSGFTANDSVFLTVSNTTQNVGDTAVRFRASLTAPHRTTVTPTWFVKVNTNDVLQLFAYNATGARGMVDEELSGLRAVYLAPVLT